MCASIYLGTVGEHLEERQMQEAVAMEAAICVLIKLLVGIVMC